jgi:hypothetical protein
MGRHSRLNISDFGCWILAASVASGCVLDWSKKRDASSEKAADSGQDAAATASRGDAGSGEASSGDAGAGDAGSEDAQAGHVHDDAGAQAPDCSRCDPIASCTIHGHTVDCTCPDTHSGDGMTCTPKCDTAGCDAHAECTITDGTATCTCKTPYVGDGQQCTFDSTCSLLDCDSEATCVVQGDDRSCECRPGFSGDGTTTCTNIDDCSPNPCAHGQCVDGIADYTCTCPNGYSGKQCQIDACNPSPCQSGFTCARTASGASCTPTCAPNCEAGSACTASDQCGGGGVCDATEHICLLQTCAGGTISLQADVARLQYCVTISSSVTLQINDSSGPTHVTLPYTKTIQGDLQLGGSEQADSLIEIVLPKLQTVTGSLITGLLTAVQRLDAPQLQNVGGALGVAMATFNYVNLQNLTAVHGNLTLAGLNYLNDTLYISKLSRVDGVRYVQYLPNTPWSSIKNLLPLGDGTGSISEIGCNLCPDNANNRYNCSSSATCQ